MEYAEREYVSGRVRQKALGLVVDYVKAERGFLLQDCDGEWHAASILHSGQAGAAQERPHAVAVARQLKLLD